GDLESLDDSKTPKLQAAKAMSVRLWHCAIENVVNTHCCQFPIGHWPLELDTGNNGNISKGAFTQGALPPARRRVGRGVVQRLVEDGSPHQAMRKQQRAIHLRQGFATPSVSFAEEHS
ncbi:MAG: hypothetical protein IJ146_10145, partial [Kiritimatiellae bacterium]|nr:hypothetical protein [Kiritimatiellia bacterium]